jgi:hypothetical protein
MKIEHFVMVSSFAYLQTYQVVVLGPEVIIDSWNQMHFVVAAVNCWSQEDPLGWQNLDYLEFTIIETTMFEIRLKLMVN